MNPLDKATVLIPTRNRYDYLKRILTYYTMYPPLFKIVMIDSSSDPINDSELLKLLRSNTIIYCKYDPLISFQEKCFQGMKKVNTDYVLLCADDDFIVPKAIEECVLFLEQNLKYSIARGFYCSHHLRKNKKGGNEFVWLPDEIATSTVYDRPSERLRYHLSNYNLTFYAVHRTEIMKFIWEESAKYTSDMRFMEILPSALSLIYGKMKVLPVFYGSCESIPDSCSRICDPWNVLVQRDDFQDRCEKVMNCLAEHLTKQELLTAKASAKIARESLDAYLVFTKKYKNHYLREKVKEILKKLQLYDSINCMRKFKKKYLSFRYMRFLRAKNQYARLLEDKKSKYYSDFRKIKDIVIEYRINT